MMLAFLKDLVTEKDGESYCIAKVLWGVGVVTFIVLGAWAVFHGKDFDAEHFGSGLGYALGGGGAGVWAKGKTEGP